MHPSIPPSGTRAWLCWLSLALALDSVMIAATGFFLMDYYTPSVTEAYGSIQSTHLSVTFGLLARNFHRWGAHINLALTAFLLIVLAVAIVRRSRLLRREWTAAVAVIAAWFLTAALRTASTLFNSASIPGSRSLWGGRYLLQWIVVHLGGGVVLGVVQLAAAFVLWSSRLRRAGRQLVGTAK